ncbi:MAG: glycosyltransferase [Leptospiraceae bacterium]|nr:glycosyltransferase [Leptospiraceae bacterium]MCP5497998.1 glycosyltransferase [Leptospiraceae bacterium]
MPLKIIYFSDTFLPKIDGITLSIKNFSELLSLRGHQFLICSPRYGEDDFYRINENIKVERFFSGFLPSYPDIKVVLPNPSKVRRVIKDFQPDLVHIHTPGLLGQYAINAAEKYGIPVVGTYHTLTSEQDTYISLYRMLKIDKLFLKVNKFNKRLKIKDMLDFEKYTNFNITKKIILKVCNNLYNRCDLIISPSHLLKDQLIEFKIKKPITVVSNGMDLKRFHGEIKELNPNLKLLHVGRISYEKNCDVVIKAFKIIQEKLPTATLTIIGDGPALSSLQLQAEQLNLKDKIIFKGFIDNSELHKHYPMYDLFITASTMETQGIVILEAIACGLPAIGVKSFAIPELVQDNINGFNPEPFNVNEIAEKTIEVLTDPEKYKQFSENSLKIAQNHDLNKCVDLMEEVYEKLASIKDKKKKLTFLDLLV